MKRVTTALAGFAVGLMLALPAWSKIPLIPVEGALETEALDIYLLDDHTGAVLGRSCDDCDLRSFRITSETRAYQDNQPVDIRDAQYQRGKEATIIYNLESGHATEIHW